MTTKGANLTDPRHNIPTVAVFLPVVGKEGRGGEKGGDEKTSLAHASHQRTKTQ